MRYEQSTDGIRVCVQPRFSLADSDPADAGDDTEVDGEGVVGEQPHLNPGDSHEYRSYCVLRSPVGYMEGYYTFGRPDGSQFRVEVPRFALSGPFVLQVPQDEDDDESPVMN